MRYIVLAAIVIAVIVVAADTVRERRRRRARPRVDLALRAHIAARSEADVATALAERLARAPQVEEDEAPEGLGGIWDRLVDVVELTSFRPQLAEGTELKVFRLRWGDDYAMIASPDRTEHFRIEVWEADVVRKMDGTRTVEELIVDRLQEQGDLDPSVIVSLVDLLRSGGMLGARPLDIPGLVASALNPASSARRRLREFATTLRIGWGGAERFTIAVYRGGLRWAFTPVGVIVLAAIAFLGLAAFVGVFTSDRFSLDLRTAPAEAGILLALGFFLTFAHELGHALTLVHHRRRVLGAGFFILFGSPAFYVDASDVLMLDARKRIQQALAGPLAEMVLAGIASILLFLDPGISFGPLLYRFALINYFVIFENLIPLLDLDGYWILSDLIEAPDLRQRSLAFLGSDLWHKLARRERFTKQEVGLGLYGVIGFAYTVFSFWIAFFFWRQLFGGILRDLWDGGIWSRLLLLLLIVFFTGPAIRGLIGFVRGIGRRVRALVDRVTFRAQRAWRVEAARAIDRLPAFEDLPTDVLSDLAGRVRLRTVAPAIPVFRRGDRPDALYVVRRGRVAVEDADPDTGDTRVLRTLGAGESFGEIGLLTGAPRGATVRAQVETQLFEIDKGTFDRLLADVIEAPDFAPTIQSYAELRSLPLFRTLTTAELSVVLEHGSWLSAAPGDVLIEQGEPGDAFYVVGSGRVEVVRDGERVVRLGAGEHFGELALLNDAPRNASVIALTPARLFRLDREGFDRVVAAGLPRGPDGTGGRTMGH